MLGVGFAAIFMNSSSGGLGLGLLLVSGVTGLVSAVVALGQYFSSRRRNNALLRHYTRALDALDGERDERGGAAEGEVAQALRAEAEERRANDLPLVTSDARVVPGYSLPPDVAPTLVEEIGRRPGALWQRRSSDPDFLAVRIGIGQAAPRLQVELSERRNALSLPDRNRGFATQQARAAKLVEGAQTLSGVPIVAPLRAHASVAIVAHPHRHEQANMALRALLGQIALLHSPYDAQIIVIAPEQREPEWNWTRALAAGIDREIPPLIGYSVEKGAAQIESLHALLTQREQRLIERGAGHSAEQPPTPHLVLALDTLMPAQGQSAAELLALAPVALALRRGAELGVTVISTHLAIESAPAQCTLLLDIEQRQARTLRPDAPAAMTCAALDGLAATETAPVAHVLSRYQPRRDGERELPAVVDLLTLFGSARVDPGAYDIEALWNVGRARLEAEHASFVIPIGRTTAPEPLTIDFLKDGPHGLLIGKTGSGKSELLRSIIAALAMLYPPDKVNFVLVDYKGGLGLDAYAGLPHTLAFQTNLQQPGQTKRFLNMLESEIRDRQKAKQAKQPMPRLFVIIDEFAEMVARHGPADTESDLIMDQLLRILRLGRQLDVHLLFASQRPESAVARLRGYVQYRISLRTDTEEDSKEIIGRPDAALLPAAFPGRGYLLRGDYQLQAFQAARVAMPIKPGAAGAWQALGLTDPESYDEIIIARMKKQSGVARGRWPAALPTPDAEAPTPLVLYLHGGLRRVSGAWVSSASASQRPPLMVAPVGWYDRPSTRTQDWLQVDLLGHQGALRGGPLLVTGDLNAGKTTTLQTLLLYFAQNYSPNDLRWFVINPTNGFDEFAVMAHARDVVEPDLRNIVTGDDPAEFEAWLARLERAMKTPASDRGRLLLALDDFDDVAERTSQKLRDKLHELTRTAIKGRPQGIYLALSAAKQGTNMTLPANMVSSMSTKIVLHMSNRTTMADLVGGRLPMAIEAAPGRGFAYTRSSLDLIQVAAPVYGATENDRAEGIRGLLAQSRWRAG